MSFSKGNLILACTSFEKKKGTKCTWDNFPLCIKLGLFQLLFEYKRNRGNLSVSAGHGFY